MAPRPELLLENDEAEPREHGADLGGPEVLNNATVAGFADAAGARG
jgi:hypothetical protein